MDEDFLDESKFGVAKQKPLGRDDVDRKDRHREPDLDGSVEADEGVAAENTKAHRSPDSLDKTTESPTRISLASDGESVRYEQPVAVAHAGVFVVTGQLRPAVNGQAVLETDRPLHGEIVVGGRSLVGSEQARELKCQAELDGFVDHVDGDLVVHKLVVGDVEVLGEGNMVQEDPDFELQIHADDELISEFANEAEHYENHLHYNEDGIHHCIVETEQNFQRPFATVTPNKYFGTFEIKDTFGITTHEGGNTDRKKRKYFPSFENGLYQWRWYQKERGSRMAITDPQKKIVPQVKSKDAGQTMFEFRDRDPLGLWNMSNNGSDSIDSAGASERCNLSGQNDETTTMCSSFSSSLSKHAITLEKIMNDEPLNPTKTLEDLQAEADAPNLLSSDMLKIFKKLTSEKKSASSHLASCLSIVNNSIQTRKENWSQNRDDKLKKANKELIFVRKMGKEKKFGCVICHDYGNSFEEYLNGNNESSLYTQRSTANQHLNDKHREIKNYECVLCGKEFCTRQLLRNHSNTHQMKNKINCICEKSFASMKPLQTHFNTKCEKSDKMKLVFHKNCTNKEKIFSYCVVKEYPQEKQEVTSRGRVRKGKENKILHVKTSIFGVQ